MAIHSAPFVELARRDVTIAGNTTIFFKRQWIHIDAANDTSKVLYETCNTLLQKKCYQNQVNSTNLKILKNRAKERVS